MENYSFKTVTFGGFDKQDVVYYIEQASEKAASVQRALETENENLRKQVEEQAAQLEQLRAQVEELTSQQKQLQDQLNEEHIARKALEPLRSAKETAEQLTKEVAALRPDAEAYRQFRERLGSIECEARKRADDLEAASAAQTRRTLAEFRNRYQKLMDTFEATASHVSSELRKIEVNLSQLPRAMDQAGSELEALSAHLEKTENP